MPVRGAPTRHRCRARHASLAELAHVRVEDGRPAAVLAADRRRGEFFLYGSACPAYGTEFSLFAISCSEDANLSIGAFLCGADGPTHPHRFLKSRHHQIITLASLFVNAMLLTMVRPP
jgi:hypothetical protein